MSEFKVVDRSGDAHILTADAAATVMERIRDADIQDSFALCGGFCSCATCHVYVEDGAFERLPAMSPDEDELLDSSAHRRSTSRLSCQVRAGEALDGVRIVIAPQD